jgi:hypothetical protein
MAVHVDPPETIGPFLTEKVDNMRAWARENGCTVPDVFLTEVMVVAMAEELRRTCRQAIEDRDFVDLMQAAPEALRPYVVQVQSRPAMRDKFWRYLKLFVETVNFQSAY